MWVHFVGAFCGCILWVHFVGAVCGCILWVHFVGAVWWGGGRGLGGRRDTGGCCPRPACPPDRPLGCCAPWLQVADKATKVAALTDVLSVYGAGGKAIVFTNTKMMADEVAAAINRNQVGAAGGCRGWGGLRVARAAADLATRRGRPAEGGAAPLPLSGRRSPPPPSPPQPAARRGPARRRPPGGAREGAAALPRRRVQRHGGHRCGGTR